jgi:hypothetical protein
VTTKTVLPEAHRPLTKAVVSAPTLTTFSGTGILRPGLNEVGIRITPGVSEEVRVTQTLVLEEVRVAQTLVLEEVSTKKQSSRIQKKQKGGCDKLTLTLKQLKVKGNY